MAASNINVVAITGNLTKDPELRSTPSGTSVCKLRVAVNSRRKDGQSGEWVDKPNYFDVTVWGAQGENCANYLSKGRPVAVEGRLDWREWEAQDGSKRQAVEIIANSVQFLGSRDGQRGRNGGGNGFQAEVGRPGRHLGLRGRGESARAAARTTTSPSRAPTQFAPQVLRVAPREPGNVDHAQTAETQRAAAAGAAASPIAAARASTRGSTSRRSTTRT